MKKNLRIVAAIILFIPSFPILSISISLMGIGTICGLIAIFEAPFKWMADKPDAWADAGMGFSMVTAPIWYPFAAWYRYVQEGIFDA